MNEISIAAKIVLANTFVMYFKAHSHHWNVEGSDFAQLHDFFGDMYEELYGAVDPIAEEIRAMGDYAPRSLNDLYMHKTVMDQSSVANAKEMIIDLANTNAVTLESLNKLFTLLNEANDQGFADFIAGRIDAHKKHGWMLRSFLKGE